MPEDRKEWKKPELVVLVRSKPEESVLNACKSPSSSFFPAFADGCAWGYAYDCVDSASS